jgi:ABC-type sugar transport system ATPase subunit
MNFLPCQYDAATHGVSIQTHTDTILYHLPAEIKQSVSSLQDGADLILGIRPEDVYIHTEPVADSFESLLVLMEALGSENIHHLQHGDLLFVSRTSPADVYPEGHTVWVTFETAGIRLFDRKTEAAI